MERRRLTAEELQNAETYIPLARKYAIVQILAPGCIERTGSGFWRENLIGRRLVERYILTGFYLRLTDTSGLDKEPPEFRFTLEDYDRLSAAEDDLWAIDGQLAQVLTKDLQDTRELLDREIAARLAEKNDPLGRLEEAMRLGLTPEVVQELQKAVEGASSVTADAVPPSPKGEGSGEDERK